MGTHYEYISTWVDDVLLTSKNPEKLIEDLRVCRYKLKGVGAPEFWKTEIQFVGEKVHLFPIFQDLHRERVYRNRRDYGDQTLKLPHPNGS